MVVEHVNRNVEARRAAHRRDREALGALRAQMHQLAAFQGRLMVLLQQITAYVDTRDREASGGALVLNAAISGVAETQGKYKESLEARERRYERRTSAIAAAHEELRGMIGVNQQAIVALKRAIQDHPVGAPAGSAAAAPGAAAFAPSLDAYKYVGFEDQFRGSRAVIRARLESYVPYFSGLPAGGVLDVGCGRGEFLDLLKSHGIPSRGIDLNHEMAEECRARGFDVREADAVTYLSGLPDASLGGIFAAQVVEHMEPAYLLRFLELAFEKLQPGGRMVLETLNPACWTAFFESYVRDITHRCPLHPDTLKYLVLASGFSRAEIEFRSPVPLEDRLQPLMPGADAGPDSRDLVETFNANVDKLNGRMFTNMDYAIVAGKGAAE
jgi:O-antigen chain-terminating methyltransferase